MKSLCLCLCLGERGNAATTRPSDDVAPTAADTPAPAADPLTDMVYLFCFIKLFNFIIYFLYYKIIITILSLCLCLCLCLGVG